MPQKKSKPKKVTAEDQIGDGMAKKATKQVESHRKSRTKRLDDIMKQMRFAQSTDAHQ